MVPKNGILKNVLAAAVGTALLAWSGSSMADQYRADEFFGLDPSYALLSPKPLGPASQFTPGPAATKADHASHAAPTPAEPKAAAGIVAGKTRVAHLHTAKPRGAPATKLVRRHTNPLDAQAFDTRIQVWPCRSGGICNWRR